MNGSLHIIKLTQVESSQIAAIGYDRDTMTLAIQFKPRKGNTEGDVYHYSNFSEDDMQQFENAESVGSYFLHNIKPNVDKYPFIKVASQAVQATPKIESSASSSVAKQEVTLPSAGQLVTLDPSEYVRAAYAPFQEALDSAIVATEGKMFDPRTKSGMELAKSYLKLFKEPRIALEKCRAAKKAPIVEIGRLLDSKAKELSIRLEKGEAVYESAISAEKERIAAEAEAKAKAEGERQSALQAKIDDIRNAPARAALLSADEIENILSEVDSIPLTETFFAERAAEAVYVSGQVIPQLKSLLSGKRAQEQLAAQAESQRLENERQAKEHADQKEAEAQRQREELEAEAERQRQERAELDKQRAEIAANQKKIDDFNAEQERMRIAAETKRQLEEQAAARAKQQKIDDEVRAEAEYLEKQKEAEEEATEKMFAEVAKAEAAEQARIEAEAALKPTELAKDTKPEYKAPKTRPSDAAIIGVLALNYQVSEPVVIGWLHAMDLEAEVRRVHGIAE